MTTADIHAAALGALHAFYSQAWASLCAAVPQNCGLSHPLLLGIHPEYFRSPTRLMVVGQQTNGWGTDASGYLGEPLGSDPVRVLMDVYAQFELGRTYVKSPFWRAAHLIHSALNPAAAANGFAWSNLVKVDQSNGRPETQFEEIVAGFELLQTEIKILMPDVVVFLTGPYYRERFQRTFPRSTTNVLTPVLSQVDLDLNAGASPLAWYTYHPKYLRLARRWNVLDEIAARTRAILRKDAAEPAHAADRPGWAEAPLGRHPPSGHAAEA